jgi:UDP-2,3-diacylglucosamine hydrolase
MSRLGIIAGGGGLPGKLIEACRRDQRPFFVLGLKGQTDGSILLNTSHAWSKLGATTESISILKQNGVDTLVMAGSIRRPSLAEIRPDLRTVQVFAKLGVRALGDDALLRTITGELEKDGFRIIGVQEIEPGLIAPEGLLGAKQPTPENRADIEFGIKVTKTLGLLDVGQACVVQQGIVLGIEAVEGTDALLERSRKLRRKGGGGVLVKSCKPQQDKRVDLPAVGLRTVRRAFEAGLDGIAMEAGASLLLDREEVVAAADRLGLFMLGFKA